MSFSVPSQADFLDFFDRELAPKLLSRAPTFRAVIAEIVKRPAPLIIETGCLRGTDCWAGDGHSTIVYDLLAQATGGHVLSIDLNSSAVAIARSMVSDRVRVIHADSIQMLSQLNVKADLLYLDSYDLDCDFPLPAASHQLSEYCAARRLIAPDTIVFLDDTWKAQGRWCGKGMLLGQYLDNIDAEPVTEGVVQAAWRQCVARVPSRL